MVRHSPIEPAKSPSVFQPQSQPQSHAQHEAPAASQPVFTLEPNVDTWVSEQMFEEDVRAVLRMMRPNSRERLQGWQEYRTGGSHYRITVSWDDEFQITSKNTSLSVPHMSDVIETLLVGSARNQDDLTVADEFEQYRQVVRDVYQRLEQRQGSCE